MSRADYLTKRIWLHMLAEGGRWTVSELAIDFGSDTRAVTSAIYNLKESGAVVRHEKSDAIRLQFSVNAKCTAPLGVSVDDFTNAAKKAMAL